MSYRVDDVPAILRPLWLGASWGAALGGWLLLLVLHASCRVRLRGEENLAGRSNFIFSLWHRNWLLWFVSFLRWHRRHAWMQHAAAYMKPVHGMLRLMGIRILLGSGGEEGRRAADRLAALLAEGWSTAISPDGPGGPPGVFKKGVLHLGLASGVPVLPVRFQVSRSISLPSWDRKPVPLPGSRITIIFGEPVLVTEAGFEAAERRLAAAMGEATGRRGGDPAGGP